MTYEQPKGFFDISKCPKSISKTEHKKLQDLQLFLAEQQKHAESLRKYNPIQWQKLKELSAEVQQIIFQHWSLDEIS